MGYFTQEDFSLFDKYAGMSAADCEVGAHQKLRGVYDKLGDLVYELNNYGFRVTIRKNPRNQAQKFEEYHWSQIYPADLYDACYKKVFFVVGTGAEGLNIHIDSNERDGLNANLQPKAKFIKENSWIEIAVDELENLSKEELVDIIVNYCTKEYKNLVAFGAAFSIKECENELKRIEMEGFLRANKNIILHGAPGTGKTYLAQQIAALMHADTEFVQFHPGYDYTDFVEGLRPYKSGTQTEIGFRRMDGVFKAFCKRAALNPGDDFVFIIDEINRGDLSKIFGELFFAVDPGYRGEKGRVKTQYQNLLDEERDENGNPDFFSGKGFFVPENVYIIGTMNDIDRSVESMDFAMRRRFAFKEITAKESMAMLTLKAFRTVCDKNAEKAFAEREQLTKRMVSLNNAILAPDMELSADFQIGGAYFLKYALYADRENGFETLWKNHIEVILKEYLRGSGDESEKLDRLYEAYINPTAPAPAQA